MKQILKKVKNRIIKQIIKPILESVSPVNEAALGTAIGIFVGLTPTIGIQMWIVFMIWLFCKYILKIKFDLIIGTALVWISNPFTIFFLYYGFLRTGYGFFSMMGLDKTELNFSAFQHQLSQILNSPDKNSFDIIMAGGKFLIYDLGYPMVLGSLLYAILFSLLSYFLVRKYLLLHRFAKADKMGLDYKAWREKYERR